MEDVAAIAASRVKDGVCVKGCALLVVKKEEKTDKGTLQSMQCPVCKSESSAFVGSNAND